MFWVGSTSRVGFIPCNSLEEALEAYMSLATEAAGNLAVKGGDELITIYDSKMIPIRKLKLNSTIK